MSEVKLGQAPTVDAKRDAIHVAVAPVVAGVSMQPGTHCGISSSGKAYPGSDLGPEPCIGIVDPFLKDSVATGEMFWLCLYPRTVENLRHDWDHPAFIAAINPKVLEGSVAWVSAFAARWDYTFDEFMAGARQYIQNDYELDDNWKQLDIAEEEWAIFWDHFRVLTGIDIGAKPKGFVTCCA